MAADKLAHGGRRAGAGRPLATIKPRKVLIGFMPDVLKRLDNARGNTSRSAYVEALIIAATPPLTLIEVMEKEEL